MYFQYTWNTKSSFGIPGTRNVFSVYLGREIKFGYTWDAKCIFSIPGTRNQVSVYLGREMYFQHTWHAKSGFCVSGIPKIYFASHSQVCRKCVLRPRYTENSFRVLGLFRIPGIPKICFASQVYRKYVSRPGIFNPISRSRYIGD